MENYSDSFLAQTNHPIDEKINVGVYNSITWCHFFSLLKKFYIAKDILKKHFFAIFTKKQI